VKKRRRMFFDLLILGKSSSVLLFSLAVGLQGHSLKRPLNNLLLSID